MRHLALLIALHGCVLAQNPTTPPLEPNGDSFSPSISDDGKLVVFESRASNFVAGDQKDTWDVFLYERDGGKITRISDSAAAARSPQISGDGRWIAYLQALPARAVKTNHWSSTEHPWKVALYDRRIASIQWIGDGLPTYETTQAPASASISRDGARLVFSALNGELRVIRLYDAAEKSSIEMDLWTDRTKAKVDVFEPAIARSGRFLVFTSQATNLAKLPALDKDRILFNFDDDQHVFRRDLQSGQTDYVSHLAVASIGYAGFSHPQVSDDGRFVAYDHNAPRMMGATETGFISDLEKREPGRLLPMDPAQDWQGAMSVSWLSADGRRALVDCCYAPVPILPPPKKTDVSQLLLRDLEAGTWLLVSKSADGKLGNRASEQGVASQDASLIAFSSEATNLVAADSNSSSDIFLFDPKSGRSTRIVPQSVIAREPAKDAKLVVQSNGDSMSPRISEDGQFVAFISRASNFDEQDAGDSWDVFLLTCATGEVKRLSAEPHEMVSRPALSGDGSCIAYWSTKDTRSDENWVLKLVDRASGLTESIEGLDFISLGGDSMPWFAPSISRDGTRLVFEANGPVQPDETRPWVAKLYDVKLGEASIVSLGSDSSFLHGAAQSPVISGDGGTVAFWAQSNAYAPLPISQAKSALPDQNDANIFVRDLKAKTTRAANDFFAALGIRGSCFDPRLSEDGSRISFTFDVYDGSHAAFVADLARDVPAQRLSLGKYAVEFGCTSGLTWLSYDGETVLASSTGEGFLKPELTAHPQVFMHGLDGNEWTPLSRSAAGEFANRPAEGAVASRDLSRIVFESEADNLVPGDTNNARDIFIVERKTGKISRVEAKR